MLSQCPSCGGSLTIRRVECPACEISIEAVFDLPAILRLSRAQLDFIEVFIKNRGVIRDVERELGVSYPTVRARLDEAVGALGFQHAADERSEDPDSTGSRRAILDDLREGRISAEDALRALRGDRSRDSETGGPN